MSEEQLAALLETLRTDQALRERLQSAGDIDASRAIALEAGFDLSKEDWLRYHSIGALELSDAQLEAVAGAGPVASERFGETRCDEGVDCLTFDDRDQCR